MKFLIPLGLAALFVVAWTSQGWAGIAMVGGGVVMWALQIGRASCRERV